MNDGVKIFIIIILLFFVYYFIEKENKISKLIATVAAVGAIIGFLDLFGINLHLKDGFSNTGVESTENENSTENTYRPEVEWTAPPASTLPSAPTPSPEIDKETLRASKYEGSMSTYSNRPFSEANATSEFVEGDIVYVADYAIDESTIRPWIEGAKGNGIGESLSLYFSEKTTIQVLELTLGYARSSDFYEKNNRPSHLQFQFSDGSSVECKFEDVLYAQRIILNRPITTDWVKISILDVVLGTDNDTCIYLVKAYG